ncbi:AI-2E family transporter [Brevibacterium sp. UCMA 11752]|uniref:AI-2E family transporter n=1 Tax=Brevibacterium sp. UCMA 11752 TaxID=2745946 RepID=UPI001F3979C8|nr:AI-2E family transporter [Brevibacterium sp. UCMA 11752]MCF2588541.1 AI-2E family transporter [Brevibacterium sp. UCMA 11752]
MSDNEKKQSPNRFRGAWDAFRKGRDDGRSKPSEPASRVQDVSAEEIAHSRIEAEAVPYVAPGLKLAAAWSWRSLVVLVAIGVAFWLLAKISSVVLPVLIALLLTALLAPFTNWMVKKGLPRVAAALTAFLGFIVVVSGLFTLVGQQIYSGMPDLVDQVITGFAGISDWLASRPFGLDASTVSGYIDDSLDAATNFFQNNSSQLLGGAWQATSSVGTFLTGAAVCLFATFFFLYDGEKIFRWAMRLLPLPAQPIATGASERGWTTLVQYVRVQVLVAGVDAIGIGIGAAFLGIPLVIPMTVLVFLASFVPVVGAIASGVVAVLVALVSSGPVSALIMLAVVLAVQQIESQILQPFLMGKAVSVHPLAVILAVTAGGFLFGIVGALFAVPLVAVLNTVVTYIVRAKNPNSASDGEGDEAAAVLERAKGKLDTAVHEAAVEESDGDSTKGDSRTD